MRRSNSRRTRGQALVEFALVLPIFVLIIFGILDAGRLIVVYNTRLQRRPQWRPRGDRQPVHLRHEHL